MCWANITYLVMIFSHFFFGKNKFAYIDIIAESDMFIAFTPSQKKKKKKSTYSSKMAHHNLYSFNTKSYTIQTYQFCVALESEVENFLSRYFLPRCYTLPTQQSSEKQEF